MLNYKKEYCCQIQFIVYIMNYLYEVDIFQSMLLNSCLQEEDSDFWMCFINEKSHSQCFCFNSHPNLTKQSSHKNPIVNFYSSCSDLDQNKIKQQTLFEKFIECNKVHNLPFFCTVPSAEKDVTLCGCLQGPQNTTSLTCTLSTDEAWDPKMRDIRYDIYTTEILYQIFYLYLFFFYFAFVILVFFKYRERKKQKVYCKISNILIVQQFII